MADNPFKAYADAGVNVAEGDALVERIKPLARSTNRKGAEASLGGFGGVFDMAAAGHRDSVLVAATDGVGTKLRLATDLGDHRSVGIDLVAMCVNDILAQGAEPLFFLDYYASSTLDVTAAETVIAGIAEGCRQAGCALIGGETAEMPGHYAPGDYDLAGFAVGAAARSQLLPRGTLSAGDAVVALASAGVHSNGFSLIRKLARDKNWPLDKTFDGSGQTLGAALLAPTRIYVRSVLAALKAHGPAIKAIAHITGGGLTGNIPRALPPNLSAEITRSALPRLALMDFIQEEGRLSDAEMEATFNCGAGLIIIADETQVADLNATLQAQGEQSTVIGHLVERGPDAPACAIL
ncbi:MAG: phosphoribosylformylglycinamidine cyclo-ligase [Pseudomonadota bacterium]